MWKSKGIRNLVGCFFLGIFGFASIASSELAVPMGDVYVTSKFEDVNQPQRMVPPPHTTSSVNLTVLYNNYPVKGVTVNVTNLENKPLARYGTKQTNREGVVTFEVPSTERFKLRMVYHGEYHFEKYTNAFRTPTQIMFEANKNQAPEMEEIDFQGMNEGETIKIPLKATDFDGDKISFIQPEGWPSFVVLKDMGNGTGYLTLSPDFHDAGEYSVTVIARERLEEAQVLEEIDERILTYNPEEDESKDIEEEQKEVVEEDPVMREMKFVLASQQTFAFRVNNVNRPPMISEIKDITIEEGELLTIPVEVTESDPEDVIGSVQVKGLPDFISYSDDLLTIHPGFENHGLYPVVIVATDINDPDLKSETGFKLTVVDYNRPPEVEEMEDITIEEGSVYSVDLIAFDPDNDETLIQFEGLELPSFARLEDNIVKLNPDYRDEGVHPVSIIAREENRQGLSTPIEFAITVENVDRPPEIYGIVNQKVAEGEELVVDISAQDPDGKGRTVLITINNLPDFAIQDGHKITFYPKINDAGRYNITVIAAMPHNKSLRAKEIFRVTVEKAPRYKVSGQITDKIGRGIPNVTLNIGSDLIYSDSQGYFTFEELPAQKYTVRPSKPRYIFDPEERELVIRGNNIRGFDFMGSLQPVMKIHEPSHESMVRGNVLERVFGMGFGGSLTRIKVNGIQAKVKIDNSSPGSFNYKFIANQVPVKFDGKGQATVAATGFDDKGNVVATHSVTVMQSPLDSKKKVDVIF